MSRNSSAFYWLKLQFALPCCAQWHSFMLSALSCYQSGLLLLAVPYYPGGSLYARNPPVQKEVSLLLYQASCDFVAIHGSSNWLVCAYAVYPDSRLHKRMSAATKHLPLHKSTYKNLPTWANASKQVLSAAIKLNVQLRDFTLYSVSLFMPSKLTAGGIRTWGWQPCAICTCWSMLRSTKHECTMLFEDVGA